MAKMPLLRQLLPFLLLATADCLVTHGKLTKAQYASAANALVERHTFGHKPVVKVCKRAMQNAISNNCGIGCSQNFWMKWMKSATEEKEPDHLGWYTERMNRSSPYIYQPQVTLAFSGNPPRVLRTMDMGAGLLTGTGYLWPGHTVDLVPVDHADFRAIRARYSLTPPVPTLDRVETRDLLGRFPAKSFDFITANNALSWSNDLDDALCAFETAIHLLKDTGGMFVNDGNWGNVVFKESNGEVQVSDVTMQGSVSLNQYLQKYGLTVTVLSPYGKVVQGVPSAASCMAFLIKKSAQGSAPGTTKKL